MYSIKALFLSSFLFHISTQELCAQEIPRVDAMVGAGKSGFIKARDFEVQLGVRALRWIDNVEAVPSKEVDSFTLCVMRETSIIFYRKNTGAYFNPDIKQFIKNLKAGDKVLIYDIYTTIMNKKILISPLEYLIEE